MLFGRKYTRRNSYILLLTSMLFLFYLAFIPSAGPITGKEVCEERTYSNRNEGFLPKALKISGFLPVYLENERITDVATHYFILRRIQKNRQLFSCFIDLLSVMLAGISIKYCCKNRFRLVILQRRPLLSMSIGGHAPPQSVQNTLDTNLKCAR